MSKVTDKYIIGLTGNIGTGKTVVRRMLEHLGAFTIDADALSHRAIARGAPGYEPVLRAFGNSVLDEDGEINRIKLGTIVFQDPPALEELERIIHPVVRLSIKALIEGAHQSVVVIEAIKLLEGDLRTLCDAIWVTYAPPAVQVERLIQKRKMSREGAEQRVSAQGSQSDKIAEANVLVRNLGSYNDLWRQVEEDWRENIPIGMPSDTFDEKQALAGDFRVARGKPRDSEVIARFINRLQRGSRKITSENVMEWFGEAAYELLRLDRELVGLASWRAENLVARTAELYIKPGIDIEKALEGLMDEIEHRSTDLQCEASLVFPTIELGADETLWRRLGYEHRLPEELDVLPWREAGYESMRPGTRLFFKRLSADLVSWPIITGMIPIGGQNAHARSADK